MGEVNSPEILHSSHLLDGFSCGVPSLDEWLCKRALRNAKSGASRTFVVADGRHVIGYYALSSGSIEHLTAPSVMTRNMPDPIPILILGRLAVDLRYQKNRIGALLLKDAMLRTLSVADNVGVSALFVHALSEEAKQFYLQYGFKVSTTDAMTLYLPVKHLRSYFV